MFSFKRRAKATNLRVQLRRLCDITTTVDRTGGESPRRKTRYSRAMPTLLCPWEDGRPVVDDVVFATTQDISDEGIGLILAQRFQAERMVVGYFPNVDNSGEPLFFLGETRHHEAIGGGFWKLGIELTEFANSDYAAELEPLGQFAEQLLPPQSLVTA